MIDWSDSEELYLFAAETSASDAEERMFHQDITDDDDDEGKHVPV